jgi:ABC-type uncharacterized transport system substrate-binding protein
MRKIYRIAAVGMACALAMSLAGCKKPEKEVKYNPIKEEDDTVYTIYVMQDNDSDYYNGVLQGYKDALNDLFGDKHVEIKHSVSNEFISVDQIAEAYAVSKPQLVFANGPQSVTAIAAAEQTTPIVGAGVINFQDELSRIQSKRDNLLNSVATNITLEDETDDAQSTEDNQADTIDNDSSDNQSGQADDTNSADSNGEADNASDSNAEAESAWDGTTKINLCGVSSLSDLESELSLIIECTPTLYSVGIIYPEGDTDAIYQAQIMEKMILQAGLKYNEYQLNGSNSEIIAEACSQNSCLYIPSCTGIDQFAKDICDQATVAHIPTITNDSEASEYALASLHEDPYIMGYAAGKLTYRILVNGEDPSTTQIENANYENEKLYNKKIANALEITFPKSFHERKEFLEEYEIGSTTKRVEKQEASQ